MGVKARQESGPPWLWARWLGISGHPQGAEVSGPLCYPEPLPPATSAVGFCLGKGRGPPGLLLHKALSHRNAETALAWLQRQEH